MTHYYCTHFDSNYLGHAKNLLYSLENCESDFRLFMFCFDQVSYDKINELNNQNVVPIYHEELESFYPVLKTAILLNIFSHVVPLPVITLSLIILRLT
jgi:hypothetical protein